LIFYLKNLNTDVKVSVKLISEKGVGITTQRKELRGKFTGSPENILTYIKKVKRQIFKKISVFLLFPWECPKFSVNNFYMTSFYTFSNI